MQSLPARHHRIHVLIGLDVEIHHHRPLVGQHFLHGLFHIALVLAADPADAKNFANGLQDGQAVDYMCTEFVWSSSSG